MRRLYWATNPSGTFSTESESVDLVVQLDESGGFASRAISGDILHFYARVLATISGE